MKDRRFTELLNLHLDHEMSPAEAAELDAEIQRDPARRRQYQEYARMQRACAQLFEREHARAPASLALERALRDAERKVAAPASRRIFDRPLVSAFAGFAAMAACVAFVMLRNPPGAAVVLPAKPSAVAENTAPLVVPITLATYVVPSANAGPYQTEHIDTSPANNLESVDPAQEVADWVQGVELPPLKQVNLEDFSVDSKSTLQPSFAGVSTPGSVQVNTEVVGFQFQR